MGRDCSQLGHLRILLDRKLSELFGQMKVPSTAEIPALLLLMLRIRFKKILESRPHEASLQVQECITLNFCCWIAFLPLKIP